MRFRCQALVGATVLTVALAAGPPAGAAPQSSARSVLEDASAAIGNGDLQKARHLLSEGVTLAYEEGDLKLLTTAAWSLLFRPIRDEEAAKAALKGVASLAIEARDCIRLETDAAEIVDMMSGFPRPESDYNPRPPSAIVYALRDLSRNAAQAATVLKMAGACRPAATPAGRDAGPIVVVSGTYGANCRQPWGNRTSDLADTCNGKQECAYVVDWRRIMDPAIGCPKDYVADWRCGENLRVHRVTVGPEAGYGKTATLRCSEQ